MGAWGSGHFENDAAMDWLFDLDVEGVDVIRRALTAAVTLPENLETNDACEALAAAAVVASARDGQRSGLPPGVLDWLERHQLEVTDDDTKLAASAVARVSTNSELAELWREANDEDWTAIVGELGRRLTC
jgi:hypothetical protein